MDYPPLVKGKFLKRYKRFLTDIQLPDNQVVVAHCTNSGSLKSCLIPNADVMLRPVDNPNRKTRYTWEMIKIGDGWVSVNTNLANDLAEEFLKNNLIPALPKYDIVKREVKFDDSRFDFYAENSTEKAFIEVKNVTLKEGDYAKFPDAKTTRGQKHLQTLMKARKEGYRAVMLYIVPRMDVKIFAPAKDIDPVYARLLKEAYESGVEIIPVQVKITPQKAEFHKILDFEL